MNSPTPSKSHESSISAALGLLALGAFAAVAWSTWGEAIDHALGRTVESRALSLALVAFGAAVATFRRGNRGSAPRAIALGLAALTCAALLLRVEAGSAMRALGAGAGAGWTVTMAARALLAGVVLVPVGWLTTRMFVQRALGLPEGVVGPMLAPWSLVGVGLGALVVHAPPVSTGTANAVVLAVIGLFVLGAWRKASVEDAATTGAGSSPLLLGMSLGLAAAATCLLSERAFDGVFGNELLGASPSRLLLGAGCVVGASMAAVFARARRSSSVVAFVSMLVLGSALLASLTRMDALPEHFAAVAAGAHDVDRLLRTALTQIALRTVPLGIVLGWTAASALASMPASRGNRRTWASRMVLGSVLGALLLVLAVARVLPAVSLVRTVTIAATLTVALGAIGAMRAIRTGIVGRLIPGLFALAIGLLAARVPESDPIPWLVDRALRSPALKEAGSLRYWLDFQCDGVASSVAVLQRGHAKRLFVNGRFEGSNENTPKSRGMLAYLPMSLHPQARRVLLIGIDNGTALESALAYQSAQVHSLVPGPERYDAAARFGPVTEHALQHARHHRHVGDAADFLRRAQPFDVILGQPAGTWSDAMVRATTREFLTLAESRLAPGGLCCYLFPEESLTKRGFQIMLATFSDVFPRVELWAGQGGDVLLLASSSRASHDLANVLAVYQDPILQIGFGRAWIGSPAVLLSQFLVDDATVRRIAAPEVHADGDIGMTWRECARRFREKAVNPVPGLVEIRDDVLAQFSGVPDDSAFTGRVRDAIRARDLESAGIDRELENDDYGAIAAYDEALELCPEDGSTRRSLATLRSRMGVRFMTRMSEQAAYQNLREAVSVDSTYAQGFANLGTYLFTAESWEYTIAVVEKALSLAPNDDLYELLLGRALKQSGQVAEAVPHYERSMALNPRNVDAALGYVDTKLALQMPSPDLQMGIDVLEGYLSIEPDNETLRNRIGRLKDYQLRGVPSSAPDDALPGFSEEEAGAGATGGVGQPDTLGGEDD